MSPSGEALFQLARGAGLTVALALALVLERRRPHARLRPAWGANLGLFLIGSLVTALVCGACGWSAARWADEQGIGLLNAPGAGGWLAIGASVLALDAVSFAWHAANHRLPMLWRFHQVHHADTGFHVTTALRFHPGELLLALPVRLTAIVLLGAPPAGVLVFELLFGVANLLEHGNFDLSPRLERAVRRLLVTPGLHRSHHVADWRGLDTNFGTIFSLWDRLAGSLRACEPGSRVVTGLPGRERSAGPSLMESLRLPFERGRARPR